MTKLMYEVPSRRDLAKLEITPECIRKTGDCKYTLLRDLPGAELPRPEANDQQGA